VTSVAAWDEELLQFTSGWVRREGISFDLLCDERINGLMPRQQLAQPGHLNEADLHNFTDLVPLVAFAVLERSLVRGHRGAKASGARSVATEDAMPLADGGVVCNCDKP